MGTHSVKSVQAAFEQIVGQMEVVDLAETQPEDGRITVLVEMPHVQKFGHPPTLELVYACPFPVKVGDLVRCPPTRLNSKWSVGMVTALNGGHYKGPVKSVGKVKGATS